MPVLTHAGLKNFKAKQEKGGKMRRWKVYLILLVMGVFIFPIRSQGQIRILTPKEKCTIQAKGGQATLVLEVSDGITLDRLKVEGKKGIIRDLGYWKKGGKFYPHFRMSLEPGNNLFVITPGQKKLKLRYKPINFLLNIDLKDSKTYFFHKKAVIPKECQGCHSKKIPAGTRIEKALYGPFDPRCISCHRNILPEKDFQHGPASNWLCLFCHKSKKGNKVVIFSGNPLDMCTVCHVSGKKWFKMPHVHGATGTEDCTACHNPHADKFPKLLWAQGRDALCVACHEDKRKYLKSTNTFYIHGIISGLGCTACHSPHATDYRYQLYRPINELCVSCHIGLKGINKGHPVGGHPVKGPKDPIRQGRKFTCTSCHNPHGSKYKYLLIGDILGGHVCSKCHY